MTAERSSKRQRELLQFVDGFIKGNGYGPSYREIMRALGYKSVSTVAIHIDGLIAKGYLRKTTHSARSLEVVTLQQLGKPEQDESLHHVWLQRRITKHMTKLKKTVPASDYDIASQALQVALATLELAPDVTWPTAGGSDEEAAA